MKLLLSLLVGTFGLVNTGYAFEALTDAQLDQVTAGNYETSAAEDVLTRIPFRYRSTNGQVDGEVIVVPTSTYNQAMSMQLMGNAQSHLSSLVNINAVNSPVQVLLNLNVNIDSTVGNLSQWNQQFDQ